MLLGGVAMLTFVVSVQSVSKRGKRRPLSHRQPEPDRRTQSPELGMEATDLNLVERVTRENKRLEAVNSATNQRFRNRN
jgi:hypothetical protein